MFIKRYQLFRAFGFPIFIDLSWLFIAVLATWSLAVQWFPMGWPGQSATTYWLMGVAGALGLFTSIVLHELGHALVARRHGMRMRGITLFIFGGVAEMEDEPPGARAEFQVAIAGPIVSVAIGLGAWGIAAALDAWRGPQAASAVLGFLATMNIVLVVFNMIPAFPLDGGRVLRSALWHAWKSLRRATRVTSNIGMGFGIVLLGLGLISIISGNLIGGLWWILLGSFLRSAAQMSYQQVLVRRVLEGETVARVMEPNPLTVPPETSVAELVENYIYKHHHPMFPVARNGELIGCVSTEQVKQVPRENWPMTRVADLAQPCLPQNTISPGEDAIRALTRARSQDSARLMVVDHGRLVGMVSIRDLVKLISFKLELEEDEAGLRPAAG